jgi:hypothetical protein
LPIGSFTLTILRLWRDNVANYEMLFKSFARCCMTNTEPAAPASGAWAVFIVRGNLYLGGEGKIASLLFKGVYPWKDR